MQNLESKWLEDFLVLEETRNFSQAAEIRNISQPAFSRRIRALEHAIGVELFDRTSSPLQLTDHGRIFHQQARSLLEQMKSNLNELSGIGAAGKARVCISAAHSLALSILPTIIQMISQRDPSFLCYVAAIDVDQTSAALREGKSDFIFSFHEEEFWQTPFLHHTLLESEMLPVCGVDQKQRPLYSFTMPDIPLLTYSPTSYMGRLVNRKLTRMSALALPFRPVFFSSMADLLRRFAIEGFGVAWLPEYLIQSELAQGQLTRLTELSDQESGKKIHYGIPLEICVYRTDTRLNNDSERFWREITTLNLSSL
ncbi:MAG: hypochlorite stress DNA-binding transcriptional regulator HypT [Burkholderiales bacterium]|jgi:DNA-binding transcriptional LysR family regulator|nr:hypochlorite stress DNA-binding transcriptional regulator HypT [Burkholderiales bacterium]